MDIDRLLANIAAWLLFGLILLAVLVCWLVIILTFVTLTRIAGG